MRKTLSVLWKRSPLKILAFVLALLLALGHFESIAGSIRGQDLVIKVNRQYSYGAAGTDEETRTTEVMDDLAEMEGLESFTKRLADPGLEDLRRDWEVAKEENPELWTSTSGRLFEVRLLLAEGAPQEAFELLQSFEGTPEELAETYYLLRGITHNRLNNVAAAEADYQRLLERSPFSYAAHINLGLMYLSSGRYPLARDLFDEATGLAGGSRKATAFRLLGKSDLALGDHQKAKESFRESILLEPANLESRMELARIAWELESDYARAREYYEEVQRLSPQYPDVYIGLADMARHRSGAEAALQVLEDAKVLVGDNRAISLEIGKILIAQDRPDAARSELEDHLTLYPDDPQLLFQLGRVSYQKQEYGRARTLFESALEASVTPYLEAMNNLGLTQMAVQDWDAAAGAGGRSLL